MPRPAPIAADEPRILVSGWAGAGNVGDELLTAAVVDRVRALGAVPVVASRRPERTATLHGVDTVPWGPAGVRHLSRVDGVCLGPGGILQDSSSLWSLPGHLVAPLLARRRALPVAAVGVGAEPLRRRSSAWLLRRALSGATVVTRDEESTVAMAAAGLDAVTGADLVFGAELGFDADRTVPDRGDGDLVVSVGPAVRPGRLAPASRRLDAAPVDAIAAAIDRLAAEVDAGVVLTRFRGDRDAETAAAIADRLSTPARVLGPDVDEHVARIGRARLVVSSRYHPVVLAARAGVPALVVSSQPKVRSLVGQLDRPWIRLADDWHALDAGSVRSTGERPTGVVLPGVERAHDALAELVAAARGTGSAGPGG